MKRAPRIILWIFTILCFITSAFSFAVQIWSHDPDKFQGTPEEMWAERERLMAAVNKKHRIFPEVIQFNALIRHVLRPSTCKERAMKGIECFLPAHAEIPRENFLIVHRNGEYYLDSHEGVKLYMVEDFDPGHSRYAKEEDYWSYGAKFTTFISADARTLILLRHDNCNTDSKFENCTEAFFYIYRLFDRKWFYAGSSFFPPRPKNWRQGKSLFGKFNDIYDFLGEEH